MTEQIKPIGPETFRKMSQTLIDEGAPLKATSIEDGLTQTMLFLLAQQYGKDDIKGFLHKILEEAISRVEDELDQKRELINEIKETLEISEDQLSLDEIRKAAQALGISMPPK